MPPKEEDEISQLLKPDYSKALQKESEEQYKKKIDEQWGAFVEGLKLTAEQIKNMEIFLDQVKNNFEILPSRINETRQVAAKFIPSIKKDKGNNLSVKYVKEEILPTVKE